MNASIFLGIGILAITSFMVWRINRDKTAGLATRWPPTFGVTLLGCFFGILLVIFSLRLPDETLGAAGEIFALLWIIYLVLGLVACVIAWTHPGRVERKAFRNSLAEGLPAPLPMIPAQRLATRVGIICFALIFVALLVSILTRDPNTPPESAPLELIMTAGIYPSMVIVTVAW